MKKLKRIKAAVMSTFMLISALTVSAASLNNTNVSAVKEDGNFARLLQHSMYFYDANMCGCGVDDNSQYTWRGNCHTYDAQLPLDSTNTNMSDSFINQNKSFLDPDSDGYIDVSGGYHDAGDHVKFGLPEAYTASTLGWGYYEFRESYTALSLDSHIETILRYVNDYFMRCTFRNDNGDVVAFCYQVGDGDIDHAYWNAPEIDSMERKGWFATASKPTTDCITNTAASLAANYINFKSTDPVYAEKCLDYAKALFKFAEENDKAKGLSEDGPKGYYGSSKWEDDYCWGAMWLYKATGDKHYLDEGLGILGNDYYAPPTYVHCWNDVWTGAMCLIAECNDEENNTIVERFRQISGKNEYEIQDFWSQIKKQVENSMSGSIGTITNGGYLFINQWGSARYNTSAQYSALVYDKYNGGKATKYSDWAKGQMEYLMGDNPIDKCYIVGYSDNSVKFPHHRASSGLSKCEDTSEQKHVLYGALVGGPGSNDEHIDETKDYIYNEVTIDYNAAFVGAAAGLYSFYGDESMKIDSDFPPADKNSGDGSQSNDYWVEGYYTEQKQNGGIGCTELTFFVNTNSTKAAKDISIRYYFDTAGMDSVSAIQLNETYDQVAMEVPGFDGILSGPTQYKDSIYYIEIKWDGYAIANSNKKYQLLIGSWSIPWNSDDDWSLTDMLKVTSNFYEGEIEKAPYVCVYSNGELVGGTEPDGTTPPSQDEIAGDINGDGEVNITDLVVLQKYIIKKIKSEDLKNPKAADMNNDSRVDIFDVITLRKYIINNK